jgi:hypothetical protein
MGLLRINILETFFFISNTTLSFIESTHWSYFSKEDISSVIFVADLVFELIAPFRFNNLKILPLLYSFLIYLTVLVASEMTTQFFNGAGMDLPP